MSDEKKLSPSSMGEILECPFCGESFETERLTTSHACKCEAGIGAIKEEYRRIASVLECDVVSQSQWRKHASLPLYTDRRVSYMFRSWRSFQIEMSGGEIVDGKYMPPVDDIWTDVSQRSKVRVTRFATKSNLEKLYAGIVLTAVKEAKGVLSHWADDYSQIPLESISDDAADFLAGEGLTGLLDNPMFDAAEIV